MDYNHMPLLTLIGSIAKEIEEWFYDHMSDLMINPEERYDVQRDVIIDIIRDRRDFYPERQHYRIGYYDEDDHWCDYMALYINGERQGQVVVEKPRKSDIPYRSVPGDPDSIRFYGNPMSIDDYDYDAMNYLEGRCMASDDY